MKKFLEALNTVEKGIHEDKRIIGSKYCVINNRVEVHVKTDYLTDIMEENNIQPCYTEIEEAKEGHKPFEYYIWTEIDGILFYTLATEHDYQVFFEPWLESDEVDDEEFLTGVGPDNEARMREAGHKLEDFM